MLRPRRLSLASALLAAIAAALVPARAEAGARVPPVASYTIEAQVNAEHAITGRETVRFTNRTRFSFEDLRLHLYLNAWKNRPLHVAHRAVARRRKGRPGGAHERGEPVGLFRDPPHRPRGRHRPDAVAAHPLAGRRQSRRPDARLRRAAAAGRARRDSRLSRGLGGPVSARGRAHGLEGRLPSRRPVVPEARRRDRRRMERAPVPRRDRVLRGLRRLRRDAHAAEGGQGPCRRDGRPQGRGRHSRRPRARALHGGGRARLRLHGLPALRGRARHVHRARPSERRHRPAPAARPPPRAGPVSQGRQGRPRGLRHAVSPVSLSPDHRRGPAVGQPHGGHGVPDALRGRRATGSRPRPLTRPRASPFTSSAIRCSTGCSPRTSSRRRISTRASTRTRRFARTRPRSATRRSSCGSSGFPSCFRPCPRPSRCTSASTAGRRPRGRTRRTCRPSASSTATPCARTPTTARLSSSPPPSARSARRRGRRS